MPQPPFGKAFALAFVVAAVSACGPVDQAVDAPDPPALQVEAINDPLPFFDGEWFRNPRPDDEFPPLRMLLSRCRYWAQDGYLDVVVQLDEEQDEGNSPRETREIRGKFLGAKGEVLDEFSISPIPASSLIFYPRIPEALRNGGKGELELGLFVDGARVAVESRPFVVEIFQPSAPATGRVPLRISNPAGLAISGLPVSVGVPFPRSALTSIDHLRLVDAQGRTVPMQVRELARWAKFGSVKWVSIDFSADVEGANAEFFLEYGDGVSNGKSPDGVKLDVTAGNVLPVIDTGKLRVDDGLWVKSAGASGSVKVLSAGALSGAFVEREDGRVYRPGPETPYEVEESGTEKVLLRRQGWYVHEESGQNFCRYVTRLFLYRDSPFVRVVHSWVFTGDGNRDRIRNMGWDFEAPTPVENGLFLTKASAEDEDAWVSGDYLLQYDYASFAVAQDGQEMDFLGGRAPGIARGQMAGVDFYFGTKNFWQNYPSELEFSGNHFLFHNWPRHNRPARFSFDKKLVEESGAPAKSDATRYNDEHPDYLTRSEWILNVIQSRHAHEGEVLNFRLPEVYNDDPIWTAVTAGQPYWDRGNVETVNAQGVARTEEFWLYFPDTGTPESENTAVMLGLDDGTLRAVVDPQWVAESGTFYEITHRADASCPMEEVYEQVALSPARVAEHLGVYGMWIYGDIPAWGLRLEEKEPELYRAFRRHHLGWPYPWTPYARSGDSRFFKWADASTQVLIDGGWTHYVSDEVESGVGPNRQRREGILGVGAVPWGTDVSSVAVTRSLYTKVTYLLAAWYLTGNHRAWDRFLRWADLVKVEEDLPDRGAFRFFGRYSTSQLKAYIETWEATFDPWFLVAAHEISEGHLRGLSSEHADGQYGGRQWDTGDREFLRFTGCEEFEDFYLNRHVARASSVDRMLTHNWNRRKPLYEPNAFAWNLTRDEFYLRRIVHAVEQTLALVAMEEEPEFKRGVWERGFSRGRGYTFFTPVHLRWFPHAMWALAEAGYTPAPIYSRYWASLADEGPNAEVRYRIEIAVLKKDGEELEIDLSAFSDTQNAFRFDQEVDFRLVDPEGLVVNEGKWQMTDALPLILERELPAGAYRVELRFPHHSSKMIDVPMTATGTPEVIVADSGRATPSVDWRSLWFMVPEGVERFQVLQSGEQAKIAGPDGEIVWRADDAPDAPTDHWVAVGPGQSGRLWRVMAPGHLRLDEQIPPFFSVEPERWFQP